MNQTESPARHLPRDPQLGPLKALLELRTEHPNLVGIEWDLTPEGHLFGTASDPLVFAAYAQVLGGRPMAPIALAAPMAGLSACDSLFTQWRDVEFSLSGQYTTHPGQVAA
jgi:hypothetical protein